MNENSTIVRHTLKEVLAMRARGEDETRPDAPEAESLGEEFWSGAKVGRVRPRTSVHLRLDADVVEWFKSNGKGHLTRMNSVLREYVQAHR
jgi:uncharacterized protein (DUF4415 family)